MKNSKKKAPSENSGLDQRAERLTNHTKDWLRAPHASILSERTAVTPALGTHTRLIKIAKRHSTAVRKRKIKQIAIIASFLFIAWQLASSGFDFLGATLQDLQKTAATHAPVESWLKSVSQHKQPK